MYMHVKNIKTLASTCLGYGINMSDLSNLQVKEKDKMDITLQTLA